MTRRNLTILLAVIALFGVVIAWGLMRRSDAPLDVSQIVAMAASDTTDAGQALAPGDILLGDIDAPITILEYSSLTCPHCAAFHTQTLPQLKAAYIDKGYVRVIFRPFPLDAYATTGAMLTQCVAAEYRLNFIEILYRRQRAWMTAPDPRRALQKIAQQAGLSESDFAVCVRNEALLQVIRTLHDDGRRRYNIGSTPTFIIMSDALGSKRLEGNNPLSAFSKIIDPILPNRE